MPIPRLLQEKKAGDTLSSGKGKTRRTAWNTDCRGLPPFCGKRGWQNHSFSKMIFKN